MKKLTILFLSALFLFAACDNTEEIQRATQETTTPPVQAPVSDGTITLKAGDNMKFDLSEIRVKEGQAIKLTLQHTGKAAKTAMGHNFVLLKAGTSLDGFISKALEAKDNDYIPKGDPDIIAHTKLLGGGESDSIEFTAPAKGSYPFLCSFPGHAMSMNGKLIVE